MHKKILLISEKHIKENSFVEHNADAKALSKIVEAVQDLELKPILQETLYQSILEKVQNNSSTPIDSDTKELLDNYIVPFLTYAVLVDFMVVNSIKISNKGNQKLNDNASTSATGSEVETVKNYYDSYKARAKQNLIDYLKQKNLLEKEADIDTTTSLIGWYLK